jgi:hypothetical protein
MGQREAPRARGEAQMRCVLGRAVPPSDTLEIFVGRVLRVVNDEVRIRKEASMAQVASHDRPFALGELP